MLSLRTVQSSGRYLSATATSRFCHLLTTCPLLIHRSKGSRVIHNVSLPVHSEDTVYTRSSVAFSRKEAQARKEICALRQAVEESRGEVRQAVEERDSVIKQRDALVKQKNGIIKEKNEVIERLKTDVLRKSNMVRRSETKAKALKRANTMMELMGLRERGREAYDPL